MKLRAAALKDETFLWEAQCHAALLDLKDAPMIAVRSNPMLARYVEEWGRAGDVGVIAEYEDKPVGAAWCAGCFRKNRRLGDGLMKIPPKYP